MKVGPDGWVVSRTLFEDSGEIYRYRVSTRELAEFRRILRAERPSGFQRLDQVCRRATLPDGAVDELHDPRPDDVEVRWIGGPSKVALTSCAYTHQRTLRTIQRAVRALGAELLFGSRAGSVYREGM
jgi:hypothetical protein